MALTESISTKIGTSAHDFSLLGVDGKNYSPYNFFTGGQCYLIMFICNHCPYVTSKIDLIVEFTRLLQAECSGKAIAVMSNDTVRYPDDSYDKMKEFSLVYKFGFPYVIDETQEIAKHYNVQCTPEFFLLNQDLVIKYHGRLCPHGKNVAAKDTDLYRAMQLISSGQDVEDQSPSIGCSIKWAIDSN